MASFNLRPDERIDLVIERYSEPFRVLAHPADPTYAHAVVGSEATVYRLQRQRDRAEFALKVFRAANQLPEMEAITRNLRSYSIASGLRSCERHCLTPHSAAATISQYPALLYAVLVPWIQGPTWTEIVLSRHALAPSAARQLAIRFSEVIAGLESRGIAHCDLVGPNLILDLPNGIVELIDVEHLFAPSFSAPTPVATGTPGYNMVADHDGAWAPEADRFSGAILLGEMLGWGDPEVSRRASGQGCYFDPAEIQGPRCERLTTLLSALRRIDPAVAVLFERAWSARRRAECPRLAEWAAVLSGLEHPNVLPSGHRIRTAFSLPQRQAALPSAAGYSPVGASAPFVPPAYRSPAPYSPAPYSPAAPPGNAAPPGYAVPPQPSAAPVLPVLRSQAAPVDDVVVLSWTPSASPARPAPARPAVVPSSPATRGSAHDDIEIVGWSHGKLPPAGVKKGST